MKYAVPLMLCLAAVLLTDLWCGWADRRNRTRKGKAMSYFKSRVAVGLVLVAAIAAFHCWKLWPQ